MFYKYTVKSMSYILKPLTQVSRIKNCDTSIGCYNILALKFLSDYGKNKMLLEKVARHIHPGKLIPLWYMNLDMSLSRKNFQVEQSINNNLILNRVKAVTPNCPEFHNFINDIGYSNQRVIDALLYSGYKLIKTALESNDEYYILAEDDTAFVRKFREEFYRLFNRNNIQTDIVHIGCRGLKNLYRTEHDFYVNWPIYRKWRPGNPLYPGAPVCFFTDREGLEKLYSALDSYLRNEDKWEPFDNVLGRLYTQSDQKIDSVIVSKNLCKEGKFSSDRGMLEDQESKVGRLCSAFD
jgi:hypothetical protein